MMRTWRALGTRWAGAERGFAVLNGGSDSVQAGRRVYVDMTVAR